MKTLRQFEEGNNFNPSRMLSLIESSQPEITKFFEFIEKRHTIWYKKEIQKLPREHWTDDEVLKKYLFCNVFRHLDKGTRYLVDTIYKSDLSYELKVINTIFYRFFNKTGFFESIGGFIDDINTFSFWEWEKRLDDAISRGVGLYNPAYLVTGKGQTKKYPEFYGEPDYRSSDKHIQHLAIIRELIEGVKGSILNSPVSLLYGTKRAGYIFSVIRRIPHMGPFLAYEVYCDLVLGKFIPCTEDDFVNIGPGCEWGFKLMLGIDGWLTAKEAEWFCIWLRDNQMFNESMYEIFAKTPGIVYEKKPMTLRSIEHSGCEYRKYMRLCNGEGRRRYYK